MKEESGNRKPERQDFQRRTFDFRIHCIRVVEALPTTDVSRVIGRQLLRSSTSVGANYRAAQRARSRADFVFKIGIQECDESLYWIDVLVELDLARLPRVQPLRMEANEIISIAVSSIKTARSNSKPKR